MSFLRGAVNHIRELTRFVVDLLDGRELSCLALQTASGSTTIHMEHLAAYMTRLCHVENGVDNVFYGCDFSH